MKRAVDKAYEAIREAILSRELQIGAQLTETDLAAQLGVSRTPVREALRRLSNDGLVQFTSSQRASVASFDVDDAVEIFQLRATLEGMVCSIAATRISDNEVALLEGLADSMEREAREREEGFIERISSLNSEFHRRILEAAGTKRLANVLAGIIELPVVLRTFHRYDDRQLARSLGHHREIIDSFKAGDGEWARSVMQAHILAARASYLKSGTGKEAR
ncbi:DNA-binding GntR family transcriptional regulator [Paraburkholderia sp. GAS199]|uniref:GntR family transcriptional regulator n=1 Tax=Paraburkholderia sp. GAS199 TaxID=3035126 RepID=UPI003D1BDBA8